MTKRNITIDDLARMVQKGFDGVDKRFDRIDQRLDRIEKFLLEEHRRRILVLEEKVKRLEDLFAVK